MEIAKRNSRWSEDDKVLLIEMHAKNLPIEEMAVRLNRSVTAVKYGLECYVFVSKPKSSCKNTGDKIPCLRCKTKFASEGKHNRICPSCKKLHDNGVSVHSELRV